MEAQEIDILALEADQQRSKLVNPSERALNREASRIHVVVKLPLPTAFRGFAATLVFINIRNNASIPELFARSTCIKTTICIEERTLHRQPNTFQAYKHPVQHLDQLIGIVVMASNDPSRRKNVSITVDQSQNITGFGFFSALVGYAFAPFLATLWLPSRCTSDKWSSPRAVTRLASKSRWRLPSALHFRK